MSGLELQSSYNGSSCWTAISSVGDKVTGLGRWYTLSVGMKTRFRMPEAVALNAIEDGVWSNVHGFGIFGLRTDLALRMF